MLYNSLVMLFIESIIDTTFCVTSFVFIFSLTRSFAFFGGKRYISYV